jgi:hypothetical protein
LVKDPSSWVIVRVIPAPESGFAVNQFYDIKPLGNQKFSGRTRTTGGVSGKYLPLFALDGTELPKAGVYKWPLASVGMTYIRTAVDDFDLPFESTAGLSDSKTIETEYETTIVCKLHPNAEARAQFETPYWIPDDIAASVLPAIQYYKSHSYLLSANVTTPDVAQLTTLTKDRNPVIALTALQELLTKEEVPISVVDRMVAMNTVERTALVADCLGEGKWLEKSENVAWIEEQIVKRNSFEFSAGIMIGLDTASTTDVSREFYDDDKYLASWDIAKVAFGKMKSLTKLSKEQNQLKKTMLDIFADYIDHPDWTTDGGSK